MVSDYGQHKYMGVFRAHQWLSYGSLHSKAITGDILNNSNALNGPLCVWIYIGYCIWLCLDALGLVWRRVPLLELMLSYRGAHFAEIFYMSRCNLVYLIIGVYSVLAQGPLVFAFGRKLSHGEMTLRVLSYNIQGTPIVGVDHDRYADIGRILKQLRDSGQGPQIVTIQEAFVSRTDELITESGYPHVQKGPGAAGLKWGSGLLILSEFPIKKSDSMIYDDCISWDCMVRKGVLYVRCDVPGLPQPLEIYDTHMNSDPDSDPSVTPEQTERVRLSQVHDLNRFIWETKISQAPAVFPADFNFHPGGLDYLFFVSGTKMRNAVEFCAKHDDKCSGDSGADEDWRTSYDHQFYFSGMSPEVRVEPIQFERNFKEKVNGRYLSDHYGLEIHYRLVF